ncbi:serine protease nudel isoform X2 [Trichoplusia ni]|nr:serine protease nudel isoform X2 [Trichoplusia ni]
MTSENIKKERFDQLGLPPMELAESTIINRNNEGVYRCLFPTLQKIMVMMLLTIFGVGTYMLLLKISENYDSTRNTGIIVITGNQETPNVTVHNIEILIRKSNSTIPVKIRKKRHTSSGSSQSFSSSIENDESETNFNDEQLQKARELILKHDMLCNKDNKQEICKDLVTKLKSITKENRSPARDSFEVKQNDKNALNSEDTEETDVPPTDISKREASPITNLDSIFESVRSIPHEPIDNSHVLTHVPHSHTGNPPHFTDTCLLARLLKQNYPYAKEIYNPASEYFPHQDHPLISQSRFYSPVAHTPYLEAREMDAQRRKIHPQDVDILMSFLASKSDAGLADPRSNTTRESACAPGTVPCLDGDGCVDEKQWCDGNVDCADVSDEARCSCTSRVDRARFCDGYYDCPFGEDEMGCFGCADNMFSCEDLENSCFTKEQRCNNVVDCPNHKDEVECNMLAPSLLKKPLFSVSNTEGFLHRNFKGDWYAVCKNPYMWAHDACRRETGLIIRPPFIQVVPIDPMLKINYLNTDPGGLIQTSDTCMNSSAVYVTCPDLLCGTRVQSTTQLLRENAAIENRLFGRNKRFLLTNHPYPLMFYGNRFKRNVDEPSTKTNFEIKFDTLKKEFLDTMRNKRTESRVVGGKPSQPAAWPWMVAVYRNGMFHCGGVVITHSWIISAAHCVHKFWEHYYEVQVGMLRRFSFSPQEQSHKVTHIIFNPHYSQSDMKNDLSLLRVEPAIQFSRWVRPICLPSPDTAGQDWLWGPAPGTMCTAVGWGATKEHGPDPDHMREVEVPIWETCKHREDRAGNEICAGLNEGGKDACQGDSGGPLLCRNPLNSQQWYMAGIVSHGDGCGRKGEPGVYTRVSLFVKWIKYHIMSKSLPIVQPVQECPGFKCESGISKCLPNKRKCDRIVDCLDGEDEKQCKFTRTVSTITDNIFLTPKPSFDNDFLESKNAQVGTTISPSIASEFEELIKSTNILKELETSTSQPKHDDGTTPANQNDDFIDETKGSVDPMDTIKDYDDFTNEATESVDRMDETKESVDAISRATDSDDQIDKTIEFMDTIDKTTDPVVQIDETKESVDTIHKTSESADPFNDVKESIEMIKTTTESVYPTSETPETIHPDDDIKGFIDTNQRESKPSEELGTANPNLENSSTINSVTSISSEASFGGSNENVTEDPNVSPITEVESVNRGDTDIISVVISKESLESRSAVLGHGTGTTTDFPTTSKNNFKEKSVTSTIFSDDFKTTTTDSSSETSKESLESHEDTTPLSINKDLIVDSPTKSLESDDKELIIELLPKNLDMADQIGAASEHTVQVQNISLSNPHSDKGHHDLSNDKLRDFQVKSDMINKIVLSEPEPAKVRRKHRIPKEFECRRIFQTISYHQRCDRKADCEDGTDELDCTCVDYLSTFDEKLICDGVFDCADGQDEADCYSCAEDKYLCQKSQMCLPKELVCDGKQNCPHGEDELDCFALTNGNEMVFNLDGRPAINLEGYLTKRHLNDWHIVCDPTLSLEQQDQAATHICRYLGFSSANKYLVKYINVKEDELIARSLDINNRRKRDAVGRMPIHFAYRQEMGEDNTARHAIIDDPQVIKEKCVPNITKTCKSLYVYCDHTLFTHFDDSENAFRRDSHPVIEQVWPWIAKVFIEGEYRCTGVLVDLSWVLVSESCLWDATNHFRLSHHYTTVVLGSHRTLDSVNSMHEQVYQVDAKRNIYRSKASLLHLKQPAIYSNVVKPMAVSSSYFNTDHKSTCVAVGQDDKNNTLSVLLEETIRNCHPSNRCFVRKSDRSVCPPEVTTNRHWAGVVSCHTEQGWHPAATFVDGRGECDFGDQINGTDVEYLKNEMKNGEIKGMTSLDGGENCEGIRCSRGRCIPILQVCDGVKHCEDAKDESEEACYKKYKMCDREPYHKGCECSVGQMKCRNGKCISKELFKDGNNDCGDGTDEPGQTTCSDYLARVMPSRLCDGVLHCADRSDEDPVYCKCFAKKSHSCRTRTNDEYCVSPDVVCDGVRDCPNGEDEQACIALTKPQEFPPGTGQVIVRSHGVWYTKCYPTQNHTKSELEKICSELGFISGHAKQIHDLDNFIVDLHNDIIIDTFSDVSLNKNTTLKMRNTEEPIAKAVFNSDLKDCYPVIVECL